VNALGPVAFVGGWHAHLASKEGQEGNNTGGDIPTATPLDP